MAAVTNVVFIHGGELAMSVAEQAAAKIPKAVGDNNEVSVTVRCASKKPKSLLVDYDSEATLLCFVMQTIENAAPTEEGGACFRFFKRKTHPEDLLAGKFQFTVLGLGDSNLLLDRQNTSAKDCNQVADELDARLAALGGKRFLSLGRADERTGLTEVEPYLESLAKELLSQQQ